MKNSARLIYDPANTLYGDDSDTSLVATVPDFMALSAIPATSTFEVQVRLMDTGVWVTIGEYTDCDAQLIVFDREPNFARVVRTVGTDNITVETQGEAGIRR